MPLRLRHTWPGQSRPDDFEVLDGEEALGRICLMYHPDGRPRWHWFMYRLAIKGEATQTDDGMPSGHTNSRDQAVAALWAARDSVGKR
jgi:hypothetical protein